jgi:hypothetical protein
MMLNSKIFELPSETCAVRMKAVTLYSAGSIKYC